MGKIINEKLGIECKAGDKASELLRCIRFQMTELLEEMDEADLKQMSLGLSHSMGRYKLAFSAEKVDTMII